MTPAPFKYDGRHGKLRPASQLRLFPQLQVAEDNGSCPYDKAGDTEQHVITGQLNHPVRKDDDAGDDGPKIRGRGPFLGCFTVLSHDLSPWLVRVAKLGNRCSSALTSADASVVN